MQEYYGTWLTSGNANQRAIDEFKGNLVGIRHRFGWKDIAPTPKNNYSIITDTATICKKNNLKLWLQPWVNTNAPNWIYKPPYNVPLVFTNDTRFPSGFPFVANPVYIDLWKTFITDLYKFINSTPSVEEVLQLIQIQGGTTGDVGWKKGDITKVTINGLAQANFRAYDLSDDGWYFIQKQFWTDIRAIILHELALNPGNNAVLFDWLTESFQKVALKTGDLGHSIGFNTEGTFQARTNSFRGKDTYAFFSETEQVRFTNQEFFVMLCESLAANMNILSVNAQLSDSQKGMLPFFNKYAKGIGAFCLPRTKIDFANKDIFSEVEYGDVIDPAKKKSYDAAISRINTTTSGYWYAQERKASMLEGYLNESRNNLIQKKYSMSGAKQNNFGYDLFPGDYQLNMIHINPWQNCAPMWNVGKTTDNLGHSAWKVKGAAYFRLSDNLKNPNIKAQKITLDIWYYSKDNTSFRVGKWGVNINQKKLSDTINTGNENVWKKYTINFQNFIFEGKLEYGADVSIEGECILGLVEMNQTI